ncbi:NADase-type glycan-binding domain-containing protein [Clostridium grantii]|uniref:Zinc-ribbon domain-containing protein n=1 Tax=Clostridium grantii DSM 8605 TaxID=1121316 RepID=A0A1M5Y108_9CLOT|nr:PQQ-binding-like beta-propeller repeat protein [Clostridium grantii]SHI05751.1 zinc-ribbon domain-containing protein [Clostridium grantii DSM 8605]
MFCPKCGSDNLNEAKFCKKCGFNIEKFLDQNQQNEQREQQIISKQKKEGKQLNDNNIKNKYIVAGLIFVCVIIIVGVVVSSRKNQQTENIAIEKNTADLSESKENNQVDATEKAANVAIEQKNLKIESEIQELGNNKVNVYIYALNENGDKVWERNWDNLELTELDVMSPITETEDGIIYVEVYSKLYAIERSTGNELWGDVLVGSGIAPLVDKDGTIYCIGYYGPFITAISPDGSVKWTRDYEEIYWPYELDVRDTKIYIKYAQSNSDTSSKYGGVAVLSKDGDLISKELTNKKPFNNTLSSSTLNDQSNNSYVSNNVIDDKDETAWVEGVEGDGIGEYVELRADTPQEINVIEIRNGYKKSYESAENNNRVKKIQIELSEGITIVKELNSYVNELDYIILDEVVKTDHVKFTILEVYDGQKYEDTCISGINLY